MCVARRRRKRRLKRLSLLGRTHNKYKEITGDRRWFTT